MPKGYRLLFSCVVLALSAYSHSALADGGNYWGIAAQLHSQDVHVDTAPDSGIRVDTDTNSYGTRLYVGHFLNRFIAVESGALVYRTPGATLYSNTDQNLGYVSAQNEVAIDVRLLASLSVSNTVIVQAFIGQRFWNRYQYAPQTTGSVYSQSTENDTTGGVELGIGWQRNGLIVLGLDYMDSQPNESVSASLGIAFRFQ